MSKLNLQVSLNSYADKVESNQNLLNHFKWLRSVSGVLIDNPESAEFLVPAGDTLPLFNGTVTIAQDSLTQYSISLVSAGVYRLSWNGIGSNPSFRTERAIGVDNTTEVSVVKNGSLMTANFIGGVLPNLSSVIIGDEMRLDNVGIYKIIGKSATSVSWENEAGVEDSFILSSSSSLRIYSSAGVQKHQTLSIKSGFSPASFGDYDIIDVAPDFLIFNSPKTLPVESDVLSPIVIYKSEKKILFIESTDEVLVTINGNEQTRVSPLVSSSGTNPGVLLLTGAMHSAEILNTSLQEVTIYYISAE